MSFERYFTGESYINRLDPRGRIVICFLFAITIALSSSSETLLVGGVVALLFATFANLKVVTVLKRLFVVNLFVLFLWFFLPFTTKGTVIWDYHGIEATREGIVLCSKITARANVIIIFLISLVSTIHLENLGLALQQLHIPKKLVYIFFFTIRYLRVLETEKERLVNAAKVRGFIPGVNLHTYKTIAYFIGMLLVKSIDRAENVHQAMICRGFSGDFFAIEHFSFRKRDWSFSLISIFLLLFLIAFENNLAAIQFLP